MSRLLCVVLLSVLFAAAPRAQPDDTLTLRLGETTEYLTAASDTTQHYAVYLPSSYDPERPGPILFLMDPRGRAMTPLGLFRDAAERYGYLLLSSYETLSDDVESSVVNTRALNAMLRDAQSRFRIDPARLYLVGFSGTAHFSWSVAAGLDGHLAGIIGVGGGLPPDLDFMVAARHVERPFSYVGIAGTRDFNYDGVRGLSLALDDSPLPHRFLAMEGRGHAWPPQAVAEEALGWMELQAMRQGLVAPNPAWIDSLFAAQRAEAQALEEAGALADAQRRYHELAVDFEEFRDVEEIAERAEALARERAVRRVNARRDALAEEVWQYKLDALAFMDEYRAADPLIPHHRALRRLEIGRLQREVADSSDVERADAAYRALATVAAYTRFYEPRDYFAAEDYSRAAGMLRLALEIQPGAGFICYQLAQAAAQLGREDEAFEALGCAAEGGAPQVEGMASDSLLVPLRSDARFAGWGSEPPRPSGTPSPPAQGQALGKGR